MVQLQLAMFNNLSCWKRYKVPLNQRRQYADDVFKWLSPTGTKDPEAWMIFTNGLRPEIKFLALQKQPETLDQAQEYAFEAEQLITLQQPVLLIIIMFLTYDRCWASGNGPNWRISHRHSCSACSHRWPKWWWGSESNWRTSHRC